MKQRPGDQPLPTPNEYRDIQSMVIDDLGKRRLVGIERYGTALQPFNGRKSLRDIYEELLDAAVYVKQRLVEEDLVDKYVDENERLKTENAELRQMIRWQNKADAEPINATPPSFASQIKASGG
jgi:hypothetical protein